MSNGSLNIWLLSFPEDDKTFFHLTINICYDPNQSATFSRPQSTYYLLDPRPQQTTMRITCSLEKLPGELLVHLMCSFYSPIDLRSFISASPIFLQWYLAYRQPVLKPITELLKVAYHGDVFSTHDAIRGVQLRPQAHQFPCLAQYEIKLRMYGMRVTRKSLSEKEWSDSLPFLCELFEQRQDADALIS
jgi:hypothetical protein